MRPPLETVDSVKFCYIAAYEAMIRRAGDPQEAADQHPRMHNDEDAVQERHAGPRSASVMAAVADRERTNVLDQGDNRRDRSLDPPRYG